MLTAHPANSGAAVDINPASAIYTNARYQPGSVVIRYTGGDLTYAQLNDRAARLARSGRYCDERCHRSQRVRGFDLDCQLPQYS
jgi:acyl-CoA synthetase (AMP-forming)/AMP-acid ligase II